MEFVQIVLAPQLRPTKIRDDEESSEQPLLWVNRSPSPNDICSLDPLSRFHDAGSHHLCGACTSRVVSPKPMKTARAKKDVWSRYRGMEDFAAANSSSQISSWPRTMRLVQTTLHPKLARFQQRYNAAVNRSATHSLSSPLTPPTAVAQPVPDLGATLCEAASHAASDDAMDVGEVDEQVLGEAPDKGVRDEMNDGFTEIGTEGGDWEAVSSEPSPPPPPPSPPQDASPPSDVSPPSDASRPSVARTKAVLPSLLPVATGTQPTPVIVLPPPMCTPPRWSPEDHEREASLATLLASRRLQRMNERADGVCNGLYDGVNERLMEGDTEGAIKGRKWGVWEAVSCEPVVPSPPSDPSRPSDAGTKAVIPSLPLPVIVLPPPVCTPPRCRPGLCPSDSERQAHGEASLATLIASRRRQRMDERACARPLRLLDFSSAQKTELL